MERRIGVVVAIFLAAVACNLPSAAVTQTPPLPGATIAVLETAAEPLSTSPAGEPESTEETILCGRSPVVEGAFVEARVAYVRNGSLLVQDFGFDPTVVFSDAAQVEGIWLSEDGERIAFTRKVGEWDVELWVVDREGTDPRLLLNVAQLHEMGKRWYEPPNDEYILGVSLVRQRWIPGTHVFAFSPSPVLDALGGPGADDLWLVDADTGEFAQILPEGLGTIYDPSPDGSLLALRYPDRLDVVGIDGSMVAEDIFEPFAGIGCGESYCLPLVTWTPDQQTLIVQQPVEFGSQTIWEVPLDRSEPTMLGEFPSSIYTSALSPDLTLLAYREQREGNDTLVVSTLTGSETVPVFTGDEVRFGAWSPDSTCYLFEAAEGTLPGDSSSNTAAVYYGTLCDGEPVRLEGFLPGDTFSEQTLWIDATRFLMLRIGYSDTATLTEQLTLYQGTLDGQINPVTDIAGSIAFDAVILPVTPSE